jgi:hypothetical protein
MQPDPLYIDVRDQRDMIQKIKIHFAIHNDRETIDIFGLDGQKVSQVENAFPNHQITNYNWGHTIRPKL